MYRSADEKPQGPPRGAAFIVALCACSLAQSACGLVDLRPVAVATHPSGPYEVVASRDETLWVMFPAAPSRIDAEEAVTVRSSTGPTDGDLSWDGLCLSWRPIEALDPGSRYRFVLSGDVRMEDGRVADLALDLPFFVLRAGSMPRLVSSAPSDGASVAASASGSTALVLRFSEPMDEASVESAFSLSPGPDYRFLWGEGGSLMSIRLLERLSPCVCYAWSLGQDARAVDGAPIARAESGCFVTDLDAETPSVLATGPAALVDGRWVELSTDLSETDAGDSVAVRFSEPMDVDSVVGAITMSPARSGQVVAASTELFVYTPREPWTPEEYQRLVVRTAAKDTSGLALPRERVFGFTPRTPYLELSSVSTLVGEESPSPGEGGAFAVTIGDPPEGELTLILRFSDSFAAVAMESATRSVTVSAFFPSGLRSPRLRSAWWPSADTLSMTWEGLEASDADSERYYRLVVRGGEDGLASQRGLRLRADLAQILEAKP